MASTESIVPADVSAAVGGIVSTKSVGPADGSATVGVSVSTKSVAPADGSAAVGIMGSAESDVSISGGATAGVILSTKSIALANGSGAVGVSSGTVNVNLADDNAAVGVLSSTENDVSADGKAAAGVLSSTVNVNRADGNAAVGVLSSTENVNQADGNAAVDVSSSTENVNQADGNAAVGVLSSTDNVVSADGSAAVGVSSTTVNANQADGNAAVGVSSSMENVISADGSAAVGVSSSTVNVKQADGSAALGTESVILITDGAAVDIMDSTKSVIPTNRDAAVSVPTDRDAAVSVPTSMENVIPTDVGASFSVKASRKSVFLADGDAAVNLCRKRERVLRDLAVLCTSVFLSSMAYCGLLNLQTSLLDDGQMGNKTLTVVYFFAAVSTLASPAIVRLGLKHTLVASVATQVAYPVAHFWPEWYTMYPAAAITGLGTGPLWSAANAYLLTLTLDGAEAAISVYFGVFFAAQRVATVTGSLASSLVFQRPRRTATAAPTTATIEAYCGARYCYQDLDRLFRNASAVGDPSNLYRPSELQRYVLFGTYLCCALAALPLMTLLTERHGVQAQSTHTILVTLRAMVEPRLLLLMPLAAFSGITYAFSTADYIVGYITCTVGIDQIGYVMAVFGVASALGSAMCGPLLKYSGRQAIFIMGGVCNLGTLVALVTWTPTAEAPLVLYAFAALLGLTCIVWVSQLAAFVGFLFADHCPERAFAAYLLFQMLGNFAWHAFSMYLCLDLQIYGQVALLLLGLISYAVLEGALRREAKKLSLDGATNAVCREPVTVAISPVLRMCP